MIRKPLLALALALALAACGSVETGEPPDADHTGADGGVPGSPPTIEAVSPPSGSLVTEDVAVTISFSEPMDQASVEAAIEFPAGSAPSFEWNDGGSQVIASGLVPYPEGSGPAQVEPGVFRVQLDAGATDRDGEPLGGALDLDYTLRYRRITTAFPFSQTLTGNCDAVCSNNNWTWFAAGERSTDPTIATRGFLTIPFTLPDGIEIERAQLRTEIQQVLDNPFSFGDLYVDHVQFNVINGAEFIQRGTGLGVLFAQADTPVAGDAVRHDVTEAFTFDYQHRVEQSSRTQYRIRFPHDLAEDPSYPAYHSDGAWDVVQMLPTATSVTVTYLVE